MRLHVRRAYDFYPTPAWATRELLRRIPVGRSVLEPCVGAGDIASVLAADDRIQAMFTNDLDPAHVATDHGDATDPAWWAAQPAADWVISNPPFSVAHRIIPLALTHARVGMAMLLRLSYLEPCRGRDAWLVAHPPQRLIVLPRISFTGDGKTDNVTCAWVVWTHAADGQSIEIIDWDDARQPSLLAPSDLVDGCVGGSRRRDGQATPGVVTAEAQAFSPPTAERLERLRG